MKLYDILSSTLQADISCTASLKKLFATRIVTKTLRWLDAEKIRVYRFITILDTCFGGKTVVVDRLDREKIINLDKTEISPYDYVCLEIEKISKRWTRIFAESAIPVKAVSRMELSIFLTAMLISNLSTTGNEQLSSLIKLYFTAFNIIGIDCEDNLLEHLCPSNFVKAKEDWNKAIIGKEHQNTVLPYDVLCITVYLALTRLRYPASSETSKQNVASLWRTYLHFCSMKPEFENQNTHALEVIKHIRQNTGATVPAAKNNVVSASEMICNNDLFRDPRFLRQANLYYSVDMRAICETLNQFRRKNLTILDLGCGDGEVSCSRFGGIASVSKVICIDSDEKQLETARARVARDSHRDKFSIYHVDLQDADLVHQLRNILRENGVDKVDIVFSALTFHYLSDPEKVISHVRTIMADDGYFIMRELDDDTKVYFSQGDIKSVWMNKAVNSYQKVFRYTDRNCARKMHSWLALQGFLNIKMFYDQIDTCGKTLQEKEDLFYIMVGFRKARAEKMLQETQCDKDIEASLNEVIRASDELRVLFREDDFWFFCTNYVAIAQNSKKRKSELVQRPAIELFLIRHAHCDVVDADSISITVSARGKSEITSLTEYLSQVDFAEVICSSMERAHMTALPIAQSHNLPLTEYSELNEIDRGEILTDRMWERNLSYYQRWKKHDTDLPFPNGENGMDVWLRCKYVVDRICENAKRSDFTNKPYRVCVVTHGGTIRALICGLLGLPENLRYQFATNLHPGSISIVRIAGVPTENVNTDKPATIELFNDISHLR